MDKTNFKILWHLDYNARISASKLAKHVGISKQNFNYRLKKLREQDIILGAMSVIDIHRLGYLTYRVYFRYKNVNQKKEQEIIEYFKNHSHVLWLVSLSGSWDLEAVFVAKNFIQFNNVFKKIKEELGIHFSKYNISMSVVNYHLKRDYLINKQREHLSSSYYGFEPHSEKLHPRDLKILVQLSQNCRQSNQEIGRKLGVTYHTIKERIKRLEQKKIIQSHRIMVNLEKIDRKFYKITMVLNNPTKEDEKKLYAFCSQHNYVVYLVEVLGEWQLEVEMEVQNQARVTEFLRKLRNNFPEIILDYNILLVTKEHKLNYFPLGEKIMKN